MMTNREILSSINEGGGGIAFAEGGDIPHKCACSGKTYEYGGKTVRDYDIANQIKSEYDSYSRKERAGIQYPDLSASEINDKYFEEESKYENGGSIYDDGGMVRLVNKRVPSFNEFISKNSDISPSAKRKAYKEYLYRTHDIKIDDLPESIKIGIIIGNQKIIDHYING